MTSPFANEVWPGPVTIFSTGTVRRPTGSPPRLLSAAIMAGTLSAAGDALHRLPCGAAALHLIGADHPGRLNHPGQALATALCSPSSAPDTAAPMRCHWLNA